MANPSIRNRLAKIEDKRRFLNWFVGARFIDSLTDNELESYVRDRRPPEPVPNRPSKLDRLDRKSLIRLWQEDERIWGSRSREELDHFSENGFWPEQRGRLRYWMEDGQLHVEWRNVPEEEGIGTENAKSISEQQMSVPKKRNGWMNAPLSLEGTPST
jgi:hypothetical protein